ncbi:hypothetical protein BDL97_13G033600 [Sphagnum fallax]|nr:hypothetical protein BDL97_13G033600 [Sphagnum fallax]
MAGHALALSVPFASLSLQETNMTCFTSSSAAVAKRSFLSGVSLRPCVVVNAPLRMRKAQSVVGLAMASAAAAAPAITEEGEGSLEQWVRQMLPGGFAAQRLIGTGRRKTAVARVVLIDGTGQIIINNRTAQDYLQGNPVWLQYVKYPLASLGYESKYDVIVRTEGGGLSAQAQAILLGIARALIVANQANRDPLKKQGLLTRDSRKVERKKYGLLKARKAPQYSKR